ncbi:nitrogenase-stabilizing/protective protein NifW [Plasticicumulans sp.]|uniref:nitrogenase-stabilizing/protective protein NifW n=1 Tax=Plasticicumulans sp. TaxID=2307179 RepID=UPI000F93DB46|nr:nitrogenase-stabilizing/protective protein NifW [Plasticicumulans sp.]MBS0601209.1 nitrogenase-stabilizing/protective protein NifW [Pseudomonadota bacterium]RTL05250.1 MAG: nitrogen fixation protein NifW [Xanthomonadales bacterium]HMV38227.1 nitrogenase-stabilizing/protective protein NifW [Plasticicumulans sp.]HMW28031.1 nitrogenase-stabilizing/protective protein NifW [Plasticicumulans sp.]HMW41043.1 nitrogenase-stabilizing/protective protein NifW [Plasticicumulans sp.]
MSTLSDRLQTLSAADEFFELFKIDVDPHVVHVNRLHILKRFHDYLKRSPVQADLSEADEFAAYRERLVQAYLDFTVSDAVTEKVFKVFRQAQGQGFVGLDQIERIERPAT